MTFRTNSAARMAHDSPLADLPEGSGRTVRARVSRRMRAPVVATLGVLTVAACGPVGLPQKPTPADAYRQRLAAIEAQCRRDPPTDSRNTRCDPLKRTGCHPRGPLRPLDPDPQPGARRQRLPAGHDPGRVLRAPVQDRGGRVHLQDGGHRRGDPAAALARAGERLRVPGPLCDGGPVWALAGGMRKSRDTSSSDPQRVRLHRDAAAEDHAQHGPQRVSESKPLYRSFVRSDPEPPAAPAATPRSRSSSPARSGGRSRTRGR